MAKVTALLMLVFYSFPSAIAKLPNRSRCHVIIANQDAGTIDTEVEEVEDKGKMFRRVRVDTKLSYKRAGRLYTVIRESGTVETLQGSILRFETRTESPEQSKMIRVFGDVIDGQSEMHVDGPNEEYKFQIPWPSHVRGPHGLGESLTETPMRERETRNFKIYFPEHAMICDVTLSAGKFEQVVIVEKGPLRRLLRIEQTAMFKGKPVPALRASLWMEPDGRIVRAFYSTLGGMLISPVQ